MSTVTKDTGAGRTSPLPVEAAWALISEGLHIHRYFLHIDPLLKEFYQKKLEELGGGADHGFRPGVPGSWQTAVINHLSPENFDGVVAQLAALAPEEAKGTLLLGPETSAPGGLRLAPVRSEPLLAEAFELIRAAELGFVIDLTVGVVDARGPSGAQTFHPSRPRAVLMPAGDNAYEIAEGLLRAGASQLAHFFALARFENTEHRNGDPAVLLAPFADGLATVGAALGSAFVLRFYEALASTDAHARATLINRRDTLLASATSDEGGIAEAVKSIDYLPFTDIVETTLPTPRQFRKFQEGAGPGQSA